MTQYRFHTSGGIETLDSSSDLLALRMARYVTGNTTLATIERWNGDRYVHTHVVQMLFGTNAKRNLRAAYGSASARTLTRAQREFEAA